MISPAEAFLLLNKLMAEAAALEMLFVSHDESVQISCAVSVTALREPEEIELMDRQRGTSVVLRVDLCEFEYADDRNAPELLAYTSGLLIEARGVFKVYLMEKK